MATRTRKAAPRKAPARKPAAPKSLRQVVAEGDRRASLEALRDRLASLLDTSERDHAALARQLSNVLRELDELPNPAEESKVDEIQARRAARLASASGS